MILPNLNTAILRYMHNCWFIYFNRNGTNLWKGQNHICSDLSDFRNRPCPNILNMTDHWYRHHHRNGSCRFDMNLSNFRYKR